MITPLDYYQQQLDSGLIQQDPQQVEIIQKLQKIYDELIRRNKTAKKPLKFLLPKKPVRGLYAWGSVGVGKTFLMDCFYLCYPLAKMRMHFHVFLQSLHAQLKKKQGQANPLQKIAKDIAAKTTVICFDEFFVEDIADAMLLGDLFTALFKEGVCLITTSNVKPDDLYKEGLQRERFLPAIETIKANTDVFHMISHHDYRLTHLQQAGVYFTPLDQNTAKYMQDAFGHLAEDQPILEHDVEILGREIPTVKRTSDMIWFEFAVICNVPRSQNDYIEIAKQYHTVFISGIQELKPSQLNLTTAFINLIDIFYDASVRVVISAAVDIEHIYPIGQLRFEFARTQSRLIEMQSLDYFNQRGR